MRLSQQRWIIYKLLRLYETHPDCKNWKHRYDAFRQTPIPRRPDGSLPCGRAFNRRPKRVPGIRPAHYSYRGNRRRVWKSSTDLWIRSISFFGPDARPLGFAFRRSGWPSRSCEYGHFDCDSRQENSGNAVPSRTRCITRQARRTTSQRNGWQTVGPFSWVPFWFHPEPHPGPNIFYLPERVLRRRRFFNGGKWDQAIDFCH